MYQTMLKTSKYSYVYFKVYFMLKIQQMQLCLFYNTIG